MFQHAGGEAWNTKKRKIFRPSYEDAASESEIEQELITETAFDLNEKIFTSKFDDSCLKIVQGKDLTISYFQKHGFAVPMLCKEKSGLGMRVPPSNFTVADVKNCVGSKRMLDVMNVLDQSSLAMSMEEWQEYYDSTNRTRLLNVISLEFSLTKLDKMVSCPLVVRAMDWVNTAWPGELKARQLDSTNNMSQMMYPKVQKYCLMSVKGCYTDFHIDFGGTSVWYHIIRGGKVFWLIPPTESNLKLYEEWTLSGRQSSVFFGDIADECYRVNLKAGYTFFIPAGWIHAVYTPEDSLVFGGNFLHSFAIERQLKTAQIEDITKVPQKFRYPFYSEMLWYVLARYVEALLGVQHLDMTEETKNELEETKPGSHVHLTPFELSGIKAIVMYLHALPANRKNIPDLVKDPVALIRDVRSIVELHRNDRAQASLTGVYVLSLATSNKANLTACLCEGENGEPQEMETPSHEVAVSKKRGRKQKNRYICEDYESPKISPKKMSGGTFPRRRRTRCRECAACLRDDCGECIFCADMVKFGGQGKAKQTCKARQCLRPLLPVTATCISCHLDGWMKEVSIPMAKPPKDVLSLLMECSSCYEIVHPKCLEGEYDSERGVLSEEMPNSWVCPKCVFLGKDQDVKPRHFKARDAYLKLKGEDPSTSSANLSGRESITPVKLELSSPSPTKRRRDAPPRLSFSSPVPELKWRSETPDFRSPSDMRPQSTDEYIQKIEIRRKSEGGRKRASDEYVIEHRKKMTISEPRLDSRAESRNENEERLYAAIEKTRECLNFQTLRELAIATGRTIKLPSVVVRPPLTEQQITNLAKLEQEEKERELKAQAKKEEKPKAAKPKTEKVKVEEEHEKCETPQRMTRLKAEKAKELETRVTRGRANSKTDSTPEKSGIRTRKGKTEEDVEPRRKTRSEKVEEEISIKTRAKNEKTKTGTPLTKIRGRTEEDKSESDGKKRGKAEEEKVDCEANLRRGRSAAVETPSDSVLAGRVTRGRQSRTVESPQNDQKKTPEKKTAQTSDNDKTKTRKGTKETPSKEKENEVAAGSSASPTVTLRSSRSRSLLLETDESDKKEELEEKKEAKGKKKDIEKKDGKKNTPEKSKNTNRSKSKETKGNDNKESDVEEKKDEEKPEKNTESSEKNVEKPEKIEEEPEKMEQKPQESKEKSEENKERPEKMGELGTVVKLEVESPMKDVRGPELSIAMDMKILENSDAELSPPILEKQPTFPLSSNTDDVVEDAERKVERGENETLELPALKQEPGLITSENADVKETPKLENESSILQIENASLAAVEDGEKMDVVPTESVAQMPVSSDIAVEASVEPEIKLSEVLEKAEHLVKIFRYLTDSEMVRCCLVSRAWCRAAMRPELHRRISLTNKVATPEMLKYIARRQPVALDLSWTEMNHAQLKWTIVRLPKLKELRLAGSNVATAFALTEFLCPLLDYLDLGFVSGLNDGFLRDIFVPKNQVQRPPGATNRKPRLQGLKKLRLSSCSITDAGLLILSENLKNLTHIDLSQCWRTTALGLSQFFESPNVKQLEAISLAGCPHVTEELLTQLLSLEAIKCIDVRHNCKVSSDFLSSCLKALHSAGKKLEIVDGGILKAIGYCSDW